MILLLLLLLFVILLLMLLYPTVLYSIVLLLFSLLVVVLFIYYLLLIVHQYIIMIVGFFCISGASEDKAGTLLFLLQFFMRVTYCSRNLSNIYEQPVSPFKMVALPIISNSLLLAQHDLASCSPPHLLLLASI